jgi:hypothetical protein
LLNLDALDAGWAGISLGAAINFMSLIYVRHCVLLSYWISWSRRYTFVKVKRQVLTLLLRILIYSG